jgi:SAM-dependent methyltransferase
LIGAQINNVLRHFGWQISPAKKKPQPAENETENYRRWYGEDAVTRKAFYNVGAGKFRHPLWTNVDHASEWYAAAQSEFLEHDLESDDSLPIPDKSAAIVYTSHTIEHISDKAAAKLFSEAKRVLRPNGVFRATTPNMLLNYEAWRRRDRDYFYWVDSSKRSEGWRKNYSRPLADCSLNQIFLSHFAPYLCDVNLFGGKKRLSDDEIDEIFNRQTMDQALDEIVQMIDLENHRAHPGQHCNWWTADKLTSMLREAGFITIYSSGYGQSRSPALRDTKFFDKTHPKISLYVEATS